MLVSWLKGRDTVAEGCGGPKLLSFCQLGSRAIQCQAGWNQGPDIVPKVPPLCLPRHPDVCFTTP